MPLRLAASTQVVAAAGAGLLAIAVLSSCGGNGDRQPDGRTPHTGTHVVDLTHSPAPFRPGRHPTTSPRSTAGHGDGRSVNPPEGVDLGASLTFGRLEVRAFDYQKAGFDGAATGTRVDVVTVEECAEGGPARIHHDTWRLVDLDGHTLGVAGGKIVNGNPTEDLPETLASGQCVTTKLAIGVPAGADPAAVRDGPDALWVLAD